MRCANLLGLLFCVTSFLQLAEAQCKRPKAGDTPHGANEFILLNERTVGRIHGRVFLPNYMIKAKRVPAKDIVVEIYSYSGGDSSQDVDRVLRERKRVAACLTGADGRFSFEGLRRGRYLLRAGTREVDQYNEVYAIITLTPKSAAGKGLEILLPAGT